jgi:CBS domain-containing protein
MATARDIMSGPVVMIDGMATVAEAIEMMESEGVRALIVDRRGPEDAYGIVTQRDIAYMVIAMETDPADVLVHEIQSKPLVVVNPDLDVKYVARLMSNFGLSRAPVIFDGKVQGIVSVSDIVNELS